MKENELDAILQYMRLYYYSSSGTCLFTSKELRLCHLKRTVVFHENALNGKFKCRTRLLANYHNCRKNSS